MKLKDISAIEKTFGISLPSGYQALLLEMPKELQSLLSCEEEDTDKPVFEDRKSIVETNKLVRDPAFEFDAGNPKRCWPEKYFVIGGDIGGNLYCINRKLKRTAVYFWQHDSAEFQKCSKTLTEFVFQIFVYYGQFAVSDQNFD